MDGTRLDVNVSLRNVPSHIATDAIDDLLPIVRKWVSNGLEANIDVSATFTSSESTEPQ